MKSLLQPEVALAIFAFLATLTGIRGNTWDATKKGWRRLTGIGWLTVTIALVVVGIQTAVALKAAQEEKRREAVKESLRQLSVREMARLAEELRQRLIFIPESIHRAYVEETNAPPSAGILAITMGEKFSHGHWGIARNPFAVETLRRRVRLTNIKENGRPLPDDLAQLMSQWTGSLDRSFARGRGDFTDDQVLTIRRVLDHEFPPLLVERLANIKSMENFSADTKTALLNDDKLERAYLSFIEAVERLQNLEPSAVAKS